jgi:uncharacterized protein (DUF2141 family)
MLTIKKIVFLAGMGVTLFLLSAFQYGTGKKDNSTFSLTVKVNNLRNPKGDVLFALYNKDGTIPDEKFKNYFRIIKGKISGDSSEVVFRNLPVGKYAVSLLHDEDGNGKIKRGFILPKEGIGFSNYNAINLSNRPSFKKASFELKKSRTITVKIIYM